MVSNEMQTRSVLTGACYAACSTGSGSTWPAGPGVGPGVLRLSIPTGSLPGDLPALLAPSLPFPFLRFPQPEDMFRTDVPLVKEHFLNAFNHGVGLPS